MKNFKRIAERRQARTATMTVTAGRSLAEALRIAASMTPEQQKKFVEEQLAAMDKTPIQLLVGTAGSVIREVAKKAKDVFANKEATFDGLRDIKDQKNENSGSMIPRNQEPPSELKSNLQKISSVFGVATIVILGGSALMSWFFGDENREIMHLLKPIIVTFGAGAISIISGYAANRIK